MRKRSLLLLFFLTTVTISGCKSDYDTRDLFVAVYNLNETWTENNVPMSKPVFSIPIYKSSTTANGILINNFGNYGIGITAAGTVNGTILTIPQQTLPNSKIISGSGALTGTTLVFTYTEIYLNISTSITATGKML